MNALAVILSASIFLVVFGAKGDFVVQVSGSCDTACINNLAAAAGPGCTAKSLGSSLKKTWVTGRCPASAKRAGKGFPSLMTPAASARLKVRSVEADQVFKKNNLWGVDEVDGYPTDGVRCPLSKLGEGVLVVILDSGCTPKVMGNDYFSAIKCKSYIPGEDPDTCGDVDGHGTHVGGTATGEIYGVAPKSDMACLKVLGDDGSGSTSGIIAAINAVAAYSRANRNTKIILNMSLGGSKSRALNRASEDATEQTNIYMTVAAGNSGRDIRKFSPASAANSNRIFAIGAHDRNGNRASFSNYGKMVTISAPGVDIVSAIPGGTAIYSGTSMAAPHVAGAMAVAWSDGDKPSLVSVTGTATVSYPKRAAVKKATFLCDQ